MESVNWNQYQLEIDETDVVKFDVVPPGDYIGRVMRLTSGLSKKKDPQVKLDCRIVSSDPTINNTCLYRWMTFSPAAINMCRQELRAVLGEEILPHGQSITGVEFIELCKRLQWESYPNDNPETGTLRDLLFTVATREHPKYGKQNDLRAIRALPDSFEETVQPDPDQHEFSF